MNSLTSLVGKILCPLLDPIQLSLIVSRLVIPDHYQLPRRVYVDRIRTNRVHQWVPDAESQSC